MVSVSKCGLSTSCGCLQNPGQMFGNDRLPPLLTEITQSVFSLVTDNVTGEIKIMIVVHQNVVPLQTNRFRPTSGPCSLAVDRCPPWGPHHVHVVSLRVGALLGQVWTFLRVPWCLHGTWAETRPPGDPRELGLTPSITDVLSPVHIRWPQAHRHC